jgi:hypothetical protein
MLVMMNVEKMKHEGQIRQKLEERSFSRTLHLHDNSCFNLERFPKLISFDSREWRHMHGQAAKQCRFYSELEVPDSIGWAPSIEDQGKLF